MIITHKLQPMDLTHKQNTSRIDVVQDDKYSRNLEFTLTVNGSPWEIPAGTTAVVRYKKPDGTGGNYDTLPDGSTAYQINGNVLTVALAPQVCTVPGLVQLSVGLIQGSAEINTFSVNIVVQPNPGATYQSEDYIKLSGAVPNSGWTPNIYLGTDAQGNVVAKEGTSGGGTSDHSKLTNRDASDQHPIGAITGLQTALDWKQPKEITDTGGFFTADTVEGALQELGESKLNPTAKTDAMTQAVGKDSYGLLWTATGSGGGSATTSSTSGNTFSEVNQVQIDIPTGCTKFVGVIKFSQATADSANKIILYNSMFGTGGSTARQFVNAAYTVTNARYIRIVGIKIGETWATINSGIMAAAITATYIPQFPYEYEVTNQPLDITYLGLVATSTPISGNYKFYFEVTNE